MTRKWVTNDALQYVDSADYGALGDGLTPAATALQNLLTAAGTNVGNGARIRAGTFLIGTDLAPVASTIQGAGIDKTTLKLTGTNRAFAITNVSGWVTIRDLTIDCNKANTTDNGTTTQHGIHIISSNGTGCRVRLERVKIINPWDRGFNAQATILDTNPLEIELLDVLITGCGLQGAFVQNSTRTRVIGGEYQTSLYGVQVVGGRDALIDRIQAHHNTDHGIVANTAISGVKITRNECWNNGGVSANHWGIVVGIQARRFIVEANHCYDNVGGITIDVADTVSALNPVDVRGIVTANICTGSTLSDGIHVNQADGLTLTANHTSHNAQDGISIYGRNCIVDANISHHNGRDGINFEEDLTPPLVSCGPHIYGPNLVYANNTSAGGFKDFYVGNLTNGGVLDTGRMSDAMPLDVPAGQFVQICPSPMTTSVMLDGQSYSLPFDILEPQAFDQLLFEVVTTPGSAGSVVRGAIFYDDGTGRRPGRRREDLGTVATTATGVKTLTITNTTFGIGRYWADLVPQGVPGTNPTLRVVTNPHLRIATLALATLAQEFLMTTGITGAFADPHTTVNSSNTLSIAMALRAA